MKTIIQCTKEEAITIIKEAKQVDEVVISEGTSAFCTGNYVEALSRIIYVDFPVTYTTHNKIAAIKKLRGYVNLGLFEAKVAVENPLKAIEYYLRYGNPYKG